MTLADAPAIMDSVTLTKPPCNYYNNGSITIVAYNSSGPYQYAMGAGSYSSSGVFTGLYSGTYLIHIMNALGCIKDTTVVVPDSLKIKASAVINNILCNGDSTGSITISASGAFGPPYTYSLNSGPYGSSNVFSNLKAGSYTIYLHDTELCYFDTLITLTQPTLLTYSHTITNVDCYGNASGSITESGSGGTSPYRYSKNGSSGPFTTSGSFTGLTAGTYNIGVRDANGCTKYDTVVVTQPTQLLISRIDSILPSCNSSTDGSYTITASGGTTAYSYGIDAGTYGTSSTLGGLAAGVHVLHLKDAHGCKVDSTLNMSQPTPIVPSAQVAKSTCKNLANGKVIISATGGTGPYTYAVGVGTFSTTPTFTPLASGTYTFHIKDSHGCTKDTIVTVADSLNITATFVLKDALCYQDSSAYIVVFPTGGVSPYTYARGVKPYQVNDTLGKLTAGTYAVHIKDNIGCIKDTTATVGQATNILPAVTITIPTCYGYNDGFVVISASGGTPTYKYALGSGTFGTSGTFTTLATGTYTFHVQDINNCLHDTTVTVLQPPKLLIDSIKVTNVKCYGDNSGTATVYARGGTPSYTYAYDTRSFATVTLLTGINVGPHIIHVKDANGCTHDSTVTLIQPAKLYFHIDTLINPTCENYHDGYVRLHASGGTKPFLYAMNAGTLGTDTAFKKLPENTYTFHIVDSNNCKDDTTFNLVGYPHIIVNSMNIQPVSCFGYHDGTLDLSISGGVKPLNYRIAGYVVKPEYFWDTTQAQATSVWTKLVAGQYVVIIKDNKGCEKDTSMVMSEPGKIQLNTAVTPNDCIGLDNGGAVSVIVTGGTMPYQYMWSTDPPSRDSVLSGMQNGHYMVWVHDANNCNDSVAAIVQYDDCCKPYVPNAFTPNGDGLNDVFRLKFKGDMKLLEFSVYNRFGTRVYYTQHLEQGWDGNWNGVPQDLGTYFYYIKAICGNKGDHTIELKGDVTLVR